MRLLEWFWGFLPDECEVDDCCRKGMRGNENRIYPWKDELMKDFYIVMCDYCNSKYMRGEVMKLSGITSRLVVNADSPVVDFRLRRKQNAINKSRKGV